MIVFAEIEWTISTTEKHEYSSTITKRYSPVASGPQKSTQTRCQGPSGSFVMFRGSFRSTCVVACQGKHSRTMFFKRFLQSTPQCHLTFLRVRRLSGCNGCHIRNEPGTVIASHAEQATYFTRALRSRCFV